MTNVSRETAVLTAYPEAKTGLTNFAQILETTAIERGLLGPGEAPKVWDRHIGNSIVLETLIPEGCSLIDIGTGAGLPGIALGIIRPDLAVHLIEPKQRGVEFLEETINLLGLTNIQIHRARAEEMHGQLVADVVTARAVASVAQLIAWGEPLMEHHGKLVLLKGEKADIELAEAKPTMRKHGLILDEVVFLGEGLLLEPTRAVVLNRK